MDGAGMGSRRAVGRSGDGAVKHGGQLSFGQRNIVDRCRAWQLTSGDHGAFVGGSVCTDFAVKLNRVPLCVRPGKNDVITFETGCGHDW